MSYQDWEKYNSSRPSSSQRTSTQRPAVRSTTQSSTRARPVSNGSQYRSSTLNRPVVKRRKRKCVPISKQTLLVLLIAGLLSSAFFITMGQHTDAAQDKGTGKTEGISIGQLFNPSKEESQQDKETISEAELLDYKSYCYVGNYGSNQYLFCPEEYVLKLAEYSIDKVNEIYKASGKMKLLDNGECIPDCITPELLAAICFTESTYRVERVDGLPLGADRDCSASNRAEGMLQQKPVFVEDANSYSQRYGGPEYDNEDRYNPLTAMEMCVHNLTRVYRAYLQKGCDTYENLGAKGPNDPKVLGALIVAYNQGEGSMSKWAKSGDLSKMLKNPDSTDSYGAMYYRAVMGNMEDILEDDLEK